MCVGFTRVLAFNALISVFSSQSKVPSWLKNCESLLLHFELSEKLNWTLSPCLHSEVLGEFMEGRGAVSPGILTLTTGLSKPFMRLDKYPTLLKELERHMEVCNLDSFLEHLCEEVCSITIMSAWLLFRRAILTGRTFRSAWHLSKICL